MDLLALLAALVNRDGAASGLRGTVALAVRQAQSYRFLTVALDGVARAEVTDAEPEADATLYLDGRDAEALLQTGALPAEPTLLQRTGDAELLGAFIRRYTSRGDRLSVRGRGP